MLRSCINIDVHMMLNIIFIEIRSQKKIDENIVYKKKMAINEDFSTK